MTPQQKAGQTLHERKEREKERLRAAREDVERALTLCRSIRDDENAADADRLEAVKIIASITGRGGANGE